MNTTILKKVGNILGREQIVIAVKSFNSKNNKLEGHTIFLYSNKTQGISIYSNGCTLSGKYKKDNNSKAMIFQYNQNYQLPWVDTKNHEDRETIKNILSNAIKADNSILLKHEAIKELIANYEDFLKFCIDCRYMKLSQLNHVETQIKFKHINDIHTHEIAATEDNSKMKENLNVMQLAHILRRKLISEDKDFAQGHYSVQMKYCLQIAWKQKNSKATKEKIKEIKPIKQLREVKPVQEAIERNDNISEVAVSSTLDVLKGRSKEYAYITFSPGSVYVEDCYGQKHKEIPINIPFGKDKTFKDVSIKYTERFFVREMIKQFPKQISGKTVIYLYKTPNVLPEGYIGVNI